MNRTAKLKAAGVHLYTGLGIVLAWFGVLALWDHDARRFLLVLWLAVLVDATDGALARRADVKRVMPEFDGRRLDDIIDYVNYVFLPLLGLVEFELLPRSLAWVAVFPLAASAYGFCQKRAKTDESFVGFPSYWNVVFLYLYILAPSPRWVVGILVFFAFAIFVPVHYIYPSRTRWLQRTTLLLTGIYGLITGALCLFPFAPWARTAAWISLAYPLYYATVSLIHHRRLSRL